MSGRSRHEHELEGDERDELEAEDVQGAAPAEQREEAAAGSREDYLAHWQRAQADYQNLRRRMAQDLESGIRRAKQPLLLDLLLVLDQLDMALAIPSESEEARALRAGVELTRAQLVRTLESEGVTPVPEGGSFDPSVHQAMAAVPSEEAEPGAILATHRRGWRWGEGVLRHAQVLVAADPAEGR